MPIDFLTQQIDFLPKTGEANIQTSVFPFPSRVVNSTVVMTGFFFDFQHNDRPLHQAQVDLYNLGPQHEGSEVHVQAILLLSDYSGDIDDPFEGYVRATVIVDRV